MPTVVSKDVKLPDGRRSAWMTPNERNGPDGREA